MFRVTGPVTISTSAWRGEATNLNPKRSMSWKGLLSAWISSSHPLQEPASTARIERLRPTRLRDARSRRSASSLSCASSGAGASIGRGFEISVRPSVFHMGALLEVVAGVGAVERLVAEREVRDDISLDCGFQQRPLEPGRVTRMGADDPTGVIETYPGEHITPEALPPAGGRESARSGQGSPSPRGSARARGCARPHL